MKHFVILFLLFGFGMFSATSQIIFKDPGPHHISPANPNGPYAKPSGNKPKPLSTQPQHNIHPNHYSNHVKPIPRPRPHPDYSYTHPIGHSIGCSNSVWVSGRWVFIPSMHKKIWIEGYAVLTMPNGIYLSGHWIITSSGRMYWCPRHWINIGYPIYK